MSAAVTAGCDVCKGDLSIYCPRCTVSTPLDDLRAKATAYFSKHFPGVTAVAGSLANKTALFTIQNGKRTAIPGNLFITSIWSDAKPNLAAYLVKRDFPGFNVMTDHALIESKFTDDKDNPESFSKRIVADTVLIILLGVQSTSNKELAGLILETVKLRGFASKRTTILVNEPVSPWRESHKAFSPELDGYITQTFTKLTIKKAET